MNVDKPGRNNPCPCGSGRKYKRCCYVADAINQADSGAKTVGAGSSVNTSLPTARMGIPGEESILTITPVFADRKEPSPAGTQGEYEIVLLLRRPDAPVEYPSNFSFETTVHGGSSFLAISNPAAQFVDSRFDGTEVRLDVSVSTEDGVVAIATGYPNKDGFLSDLRLTITAESFSDASKKTGLMFTPALSAIALANDIPIVISHTILRERATGVVQRAVTLPFENAVTTTIPHAQTPETRALFNRYRDALNSNDPNWRFLCFASIVEQLWKRQKAIYAADNTRAVTLERIDIPRDDGDLVAWVRSAFPKSYGSIPDDVVLDMVPYEARGLTTNEAIGQFIRPLRTKIAHSLLEDGMLPSEQNDVEHLLQVRKWMRLLRCITRHHLQEVYGKMA